MVTDIIEPWVETAKTNPLLAALKTAAWLDDQDLPPLRWVVPNLIPEGMTMLIGGPKIGKSWLSLSVALAAGSGGHVLGKVDVGGARPVLLLALEDGDRRLQERMRHLMDDAPLPAALTYMTRIEPGELVATIEAWLEALRPDGVAPLVIVDTLGKVMPPAATGESTYQRDYRVAGRLKRIADDHPGMALLILHHDRKAAADDFVDSVSGTNGIAGAADSIIVITRPRTESRGLLKVTGRDVTEAEYAVTTTAGRWELIGDDLASAAATAQTVRASSGLDERSTNIIEYVGKHQAGVRAADVAENFRMEAHLARTYLARLAESGRLDRPERGLYTPVASVSGVASSDHGGRNDATHATGQQRVLPSNDAGANPYRPDEESEDSSSQRPGSSVPSVDSSEYDGTTIRPIDAPLTPTNTAGVDGGNDDVQEPVTHCAKCGNKLAPGLIGRTRTHPTCDPEGVA